VSEISPAAREVLLAFADDEHLIGQQHTEWIGVAPFLEEDLAFASIGQDELGHAAMLLELLVDSTSEDLDVAIDALAFYREPAQWRSCALVEITLPEWSDTLVRHWLYDAAEELRWGLFTSSSVPQLRDIAERALSEERFHRRHGDALLDALLTVKDARQRLLTSLHRLLPVALTLFEGVPGEAEAVAEGVISAPLRELVSPWQQRVDDRFEAIDWSDVEQPPATQRTVRHADFEPGTS